MKQAFCSNYFWTYILKIITTVLGMCFGFILMKTLLPILTVFFFSLHLRNANHIEIINQIIIAVSFTYGWLGNPNVNQGQSRRFLLLNHLPSPGAWKEKSELWITKTYCLLLSQHFSFIWNRETGLQRPWFAKENKLK